MERSPERPSLMSMMERPSLMTLKSPSKENIYTSRISTSEAHTFDYQTLLRQTSSGDKKSKRKKSLSIVSSDTKETKVEKKPTIFDEIVEEYKKTEDIGRFKELLSRPKEIQQYVELLPSIFSFVQLSIIPDKRYFSENRVEVMKYCFTRLIDYYNVSLSFVNSEQDLNANPIIVYFHDLLDIGNYLIDWLILSNEDDEGFMEFLQMEDIEELESLQQKVHALLYYLCGVSFKYINRFETLGFFKTQKLFRLFLSWLNLAPFDLDESIVSYPSDRLIDIVIEFPDILYDNIWTVVTTFDQIMEFYYPKLLIANSKVFECLIDLLSTVYEECYHDIHQRMNALLSLATDFAFANFPLVHALLAKIMLKDATLVTIHPKGKELLCTYEFVEEEITWYPREEVISVERLNEMMSPFFSPTSGKGSSFYSSPLPEPSTSLGTNSNGIAGNNNNIGKNDYYISPPGSAQSSTMPPPVPPSTASSSLIANLFPHVGDQDTPFADETAESSQSIPVPPVVPQQRLSFSEETGDNNKNNSQPWEQQRPPLPPITSSTSDKGQNTTNANTLSSAKSNDSDANRPPSISIPKASSRDTNPNPVHNPSSTPTSQPQPQQSEETSSKKRRSTKKANENENNNTNSSPPSTSASLKESIQEHRRSRAGSRANPLLTKKDPVIFGSYLLKVGSFFPSVKRRWFELTDDFVIRYWTDATKKSLKGSLNVRNIKDVGKLERDNWFEWKTDSKSVHGGNFRLHCESPELYQAWNEHLLNCGVKIPHYKSIHAKNTPNSTPTKDPNKR